MEFLLAAPIPTNGAIWSLWRTCEDPGRAV